MRLSTIKQAGRAGLAMAGLLLALVPASPAASAEPHSSPVPAVSSGTSDACGGTSLLPGLEASGKLAALEAEAAQVQNGEGKLFRVERSGTPPSYLFGTIHLTDPRVHTLPGPAERAFEEADTLVIESTDLLDQAKTAAALLANPALINLEPGTELGDLLTAGEREAVEAGLREAGMPFAAVKTLQPWFVAAGLMKTDCEMERAAGGAEILDLQLARRAEAAGKQVLGLESASEQLAALAKMSLDAQADGLLALLRYRDRLPDILETMTQLYVEGRIALLVPAIEAALPEAGMLVGEGDGYDEFEQHILVDRNQRMVERLAPILAAGDAFIAVGALHLPDEEGLVELLRAEGWTVTRAD